MKNSILKNIGAIAPALATAAAGPMGGAVTKMIMNRFGVSSAGSDEQQEQELLESINKPSARTILLDLEKQVIELELEATRLNARNYQKELKQDDKFVKRWRPTLGYAIAVTWAVQMLGFTAALIYAIFDGAGMVAAVGAEITAIVTAMMPMWGFAMAVVGAGVVKRSHDKAGGSPSGGLSGIISAMKK